MKYFGYSLKLDNTGMLSLQHDKVGHQEGQPPEVSWQNEGIGSKLQVGDVLGQGAVLVAGNLEYRARVENDCSLAVYRSRSVQDFGGNDFETLVWRSQIKEEFAGGLCTEGFSGGLCTRCSLRVQSDCNVVLSSTKGEVAWTSQSPKTLAKCELHLTDAGVLVLADETGAVWSNVRNKLHSGEEMNDGAVLVANNLEYRARVEGCSLAVYRSKSVQDFGGSDFETLVWRSPEASSVLFGASDEGVDFTGKTCSLQISNGCVMGLKTIDAEDLQAWETFKPKVEGKCTLEVTDTGVLQLTYKVGGNLVWTADGSLDVNDRVYLGPGESLGEGQRLISDNGAYSALLTAQGNFVVYGGRVSTRHALWDTGPLLTSVVGSGYNIYSSEAATYTVSLTSSAAIEICR